MHNFYYILESTPFLKKIPPPPTIKNVADYQEKNWEKNREREKIGNCTNIYQVFCNKQFLINFNVIKHFCAILQIC